MVTKRTGRNLNTPQTPNIYGSSGNFVGRCRQQLKMSGVVALKDVRMNPLLLDNFYFNIKPLFYVYIRKIFVAVNHPLRRRLPPCRDRSPPPCDPDTDAP